MNVISRVSLRNKRVLLRVDLNSEVVNGKVLLSERIKEHALAIKKICARGASVVVLSHQGRNRGEDFISLKQHAKLLNKFVKIKFIPSVIDEEAIDEIKNLKSGEALLLENVRFLHEEWDGTANNIFVKRLAPLFDIFVLDAFSVAHRQAASITGFAQALPAYAGEGMAREVSFLSKIKNMRGVTYVLGGAKIEENLDLAEAALSEKRADKMLLCGLFGQISLIASGRNLGAPNKFLKKKGLMGFLPRIKGVLSRYPDKILLPVDVAVRAKGRRKEILISDFPQHDEIFDIGQRTANEYSKIIRGSKRLFFKGPAGYYFEKQFQFGTRKLFNSIQKKAFAVAGGGDTSTAIAMTGTKKKFTYISLAGGALSEFIAGKKLPGLEALA